MGRGLSSTLRLLLCIAVATSILHASLAKAAEGQPAPSEQGAPIPPEFARSLFDRISPLRETDGCRLARFDTGKVKVTIGLTAPNGGEAAFDIAAAAPGESTPQAGAWQLMIAEETRRVCPETVAAIAGILGVTAAPPPVSWFDRETMTSPAVHYSLILGFLALLAGSLYVLLRELGSRRTPVGPVIGLLALTGVAVVLRLTLSPRTFLHEYYHIAETLVSYLTGDVPSAYGKAGPALFHLIGSVLGRPADIDVIFLTSALISALAIPAIALFDFGVTGSWPRCWTVAVLLLALPQHLRFSAAEDLFVQAVTFGFWCLALTTLYLRTRRTPEALLAALAMGIAVQTRPEMIFLPLVVVGLILAIESNPLRLLRERPLRAAVLLAGCFLLPRLIELAGAAGDSGAPQPRPLTVATYLSALTILNPTTMPRLYPFTVLLGALTDGWRRPRYAVWALLVFAGFSVFSLFLFDNPPYNLRSQILPNSYLLLIAAGVGALPEVIFGAQRRRALLAAAGILVVVAGAQILTWRGFVTELRDQQLEWSFLRRSVAKLPAEGQMLAAAEIHRRELDAFPTVLLSQAGKRYRLLDVRRTAESGRWPEPDDSLIFYQGMFCYFLFENERPPESMTAPCRAVRDRYMLEPLIVEQIDAPGYSVLSYASPPYEIGFFRLRRKTGEGS